MPQQPVAIVFDVNETLSDMSPMAERFADIGMSALTAKVWFASVLRDGFAAGMTGRQEQFAVLAAENLKSLLGSEQLDRDLDDAVGHVMSGFVTLPVHPDVAPGIQALDEAGIRLMTLSNGSAEVAEQLLARAGIRDRFEQLLSVEEAGAWKPAPGAYQYAGRRAGLELTEMMLVAVHPWDIDGAVRAGMRTAWLERGALGYPGFAAEPELSSSSLTELARELAGDGDGSPVR